MIDVMSFTIINLIWIGLASYLIVRLPRCKSIPRVGTMFIILLLVLQIVNSLFLLKEVIAKKNIIRDVENNKNRVDTNKATLGNLHSLLMTDFWHQILTLIIVIVLYYVILKTIYTCENSVIPSNLVWAFLIVTVLKYGIISVVKPSVDNKIMLYAIAN